MTATADSRRSIISVLAVSLLMTTPTAAQVRPVETLHLTLDDAIRHAVENNPELEIVRLDTEVEAARIGESRGAFVPVFSTQLGRSSAATPSTNLLFGERGVDVGQADEAEGADDEDADAGPEIPAIDRHQEQQQRGNHLRDGG